MRKLTRRTKVFLLLFLFTALGMFFRWETVSKQQTKSGVKKYKKDRFTGQVWLEEFSTNTSVRPIFSSSFEYKIKRKQEDQVQPQIDLILGKGDSLINYKAEMDSMIEKEIKKDKEKRSLWDDFKWQMEKDSELQAKYGVDSRTFNKKQTELKEKIESLKSDARIEAMVELARQADKKVVLRRMVSGILFSFLGVSILGICWAFVGMSKQKKE